MLLKLIKCFDPKDTLPEIIIGLNRKLYSELCFDLLKKISAVNMKHYKEMKEMSEDSMRKKEGCYKDICYALSSNKVLKKLGADFITVIERIMDPFNLEKQPNIPPPFDKTKYIERFSQKS